MSESGEVFMVESESRAITHNGKAAQLSVMRNDGQCWGRIRFDGDAQAQLDVVTERDCYEDADSVALDTFEHAAKQGQVEPAAGWV